ncbi:hypothetical protein SDC9_148696 [bioreactor metagenome]|uniref:Uncharacterized protein n=1 Tax=bioreactor metagenome TaxID=1076179 RepID=A0A645EIA5_9ZZZZ
MFIPTSDNLIYDAKSLAAAGGGGYQVCDIDLKDNGEWTPVNLTGTYDGGGHAVKNMKINQTPVTSANIGLFGSVTGNGSLIKNLHLEKPEINVDFSGATATDMCNVGGLAGQMNRALTPEEVQALLESQLAILKTLGLPQSVIDALLADLYLLRKTTGARKRDAALDAKMYCRLVRVVFCDVDDQADPQQRVHRSGRVWHRLGSAGYAYRRDEARGNGRAV